MTALINYSNLNTSSHQGDKNDIQFKKTLMDSYFMLQSSKGDVIVLDRDGLSIYNVFKTLNFKSDEYKTHSFHIEVQDEDTIFFITSDEDPEQYGLHNDVVLSNRKKVRELVIPPDDFEDLKKLMYKFTYDKLFPDD